MNSSIAITSSFILGALHAFEPGHGKTALAAYTLGNGITPKQLLQLGITVFVSHVLVLLGIGLALHFFHPEADLILIVHKFKIMIPIFTILIGIYLYLKFKSGHHNCSCAIHKKPRTIAPPTSKKMDLNTLKLSVSPIENTPESIPDSKAISSIALISGLLPCPTALAVFISSFGSYKVINSCINLIIYAAGFSIMMCSIAIVLFLFRKKFQAYLNHKLSDRITAFSSITIVLIGLIQLIDVIFVKI